MRASKPVIPLAPVPAAVAAALSSKSAPTTRSPTTGCPVQACTATRAKQKPDVVQDQISEDIMIGARNMSLEQKTPNLVVNGTSPNAVDRNGRPIPLCKHGSVPAEERTDANSELEMKPPSLDGKSVASATTFALDEKESLRPDDSASMKAAAEDDDVYSNRGSILAGSRIGSDTRAVRIQIGEIPLTTRPIPTVQESRTLEVAAHGGKNSEQPQPEPKMLLDAPDGAANAINNALYGQNPDEKLLEAMNSPKDRLFLLRLERDVIEFVQNSKYVWHPPLECQIC